jgi:hypothetical protein
MEDRIWGQRVKRRFVVESELIARRGTVSVYRLRDLMPRPKDESPAVLLTYADELRESGWYFEAEETYRELLRSGEMARARYGLARLALARHQPRAAEMELLRALDCDPGLGEARALLSEVKTDFQSDGG